MSSHHHSHPHPHPYSPVALRRPLWTPGVLVMLAFMAAAAITLLVRFTGGIGAVSNLSNARPWGLWVAIDVATGVALAAGGFTTAALTHIWGHHRYEPVVRPALLTAMLGYSFVVFGLLVDIGRSWAIWKPIFFQNHHSVLFEVAMCVLVYLHVLYIEFIPIIDEGLSVALPGRPVQKLISAFNRHLERIMWGVHRCRRGVVVHAPVQPRLADADCPDQGSPAVVHAAAAAAVSALRHCRGFSHGDCRSHPGQQLFRDR